MEQLELLRASGAGLEAIAGPACLAVRELIGAQAFKKHSGNLE